MIEANIEQNLAIIILNYNSSQKVIKQINNLMDEGATASIFYVVDNNSEDKKELQNFSEEKNIVFIQSLENSGYAIGNRLAINKALQDHKTHFLILNPDIEISFSVVQNLYKTISETKDLYIVGPRICDKFDREFIFSDGGKVNKDKFFEASHTNGGKRISEVNIAEFNSDIDYVNGSAMMFKKETLDLIGMMREDFFMYYEETEWCYRLKQFKDAKQAIITTSVAYHEMSKQDDFQNFYMVRNRIFLCRIYNVPYQKLVSKIFYDAQKKLFSKKGSFKTNLLSFISQTKAILEGKLKKLS